MVRLPGGYPEAKTIAKPGLGYVFLLRNPFNCESHFSFRKLLWQGDSSTIIDQLGISLR
jgi:hypothetical protein